MCSASQLVWPRKCKLSSDKFTQLYDDTIADLRKELRLSVCAGVVLQCLPVSDLC